MLVIGLFRSDVVILDCLMPDIVRYFTVAVYVVKCFLSLVLQEETHLKVWLPFFIPSAVEETPQFLVIWVTANNGDKISLVSIRADAGRLLGEKLKYAHK